MNLKSRVPGFRPKKKSTMREEKPFRARRLFGWLCSASQSSSRRGERRSMRRGIQRPKSKASRSPY